ncbi:MAG TPA: VOC family protein [Vicinamibacteria bacterium]|nr:VOC family protein [Vicinamibacteria bacterium]
MAGEIHHVALRVRSPERSVEFYSGVLGLPEVRRFPADDGLRAIWVRAGSVVLMLERQLRGSGPPAGSGHLLAIEAASLAEWDGRLARAGIPVDDRTEFTLYVQDPDGHRVGLTVFPRERLLGPEGR